MLERYGPGQLAERDRQRQTDRHGQTTGVGKKTAKIPRCVSEVILDTSWRCFTVFLLLAKRENTVISNVFVFLA